MRLLSPRDNFCCLVDLFTSVHVGIKHGPRFIPGTGRSVRTGAPVRIVSSGAYVHVRDGLPNLVSGLNAFGVGTRYQLGAFRIGKKHVGDRAIVFRGLVGDRLISPATRELLPRKIRLFFTAPPDCTFSLTAHSPNVGRR